MCVVQEAMKGDELLAFDSYRVCVRSWVIKKSVVLFDLQGILRSLLSSSSFITFDEWCCSYFFILYCLLILETYIKNSLMNA